MKVAVIESSGAEDFYNGTVDGLSTHQLLGILRVNSRFKYGLDSSHLSKSLARANTYECDVVHLSCHGDEDGKGFFLGSEELITWAEFVQLFQDKKYAPKALVLSACFGGTHQLAIHFNKAKYKPTFIFGSRDARPHGDYATAWAILYRVLTDAEEIDRDSARVAVRHINAVVKGNFVYRRWGGSEKRYRVYPTKPLKYQVGA